MKKAILVICFWLVLFNVGCAKTDNVKSELIRIIVDGITPLGDVMFDEYNLVNKYIGDYAAAVNDKQRQTALEGVKKSKANVEQALKESEKVKKSELDEPKEIYDSFIECGREMVKNYQLILDTFPTGVADDMNETVGKVRKTNSRFSELSKELLELGNKYGIK